jgi:hypothetical protein
MQKRNAKNIHMYKIELVCGAVKKVLLSYIDSSCGIYGVQYFWLPTITFLKIVGKHCLDKNNVRINKMFTYYCHHRF